MIRARVKTGPTDPALSKRGFHGWQDFRPAQTIIEIHDPSYPA
jgi:hypothetical protein